MTSSDRKALIRIRMRNTGESYAKAKIKVEESEALLLMAEKLAKQKGISTGAALLEIQRGKPFNGILVSFQPIEVELTPDQVEKIRSCPLDDYDSVVENTIIEYIAENDYEFPFDPTVIAEGMTEGQVDWDLEYFQRNVTGGQAND